MTASFWPVLREWEAREAERRRERERSLDPLKADEATSSVERLCKGVGVPDRSYCDDWREKD